MAKITWKGEDQLHGPDRGGPSFMIWGGIKFPKGEAVEVTNERMIEKARHNQFFTVGDKAAAAPPPAPIDVPDEEPPPPVHHAPKQRGRPFQKRKVSHDENAE